MIPEAHERPCDECRVCFPVSALHHSDAWGVRLVCEDCHVALEDEGVYELHADERGAGVCDCRECSRHRDRCFRAENARQLKLAIGTTPADPSEDIDF